MEYLDDMQDVIRVRHRSISRHVGTTPVREVFQGDVESEVKVEIFDLAGHPEAIRCYAWACDKRGGKLEIVTVLEIPPVTSPHTAVKAAIALAANASHG